MVFPQVLQALAFEVIGSRLRAVTGSRASLDDFAGPPGDAGLFGPASMAWRVHAHFTAMLVGGLSSLMVQALHPRALAAVWDHSDFRHNLKGRLGRTAYFVAATTYGGRAMALHAIERVNAIHAAAVGTDAQGLAYAASEPSLIRWVHLVEVSSFLAAYQNLCRTPLQAVQCDGYLAEMTQVGHRLGALDLPQTVHGTGQALQDFVPELHFDARTREIWRLIEAYPADLPDRPFMALALQSALDLMPGWAMRLAGREPACQVRQQASRVALMLAGEPVQWMLDQQGVAATARQRVQAVASA